jgi:hypothetical protein
MLPDVPRRPLHATLTGTDTGERRHDRLNPVPCSACGHDVIRVMLRTAYVVYFRCDRCSSMWSMAKPGQEPGDVAFGTKTG